MKLKNLTMLVFMILPAVGLAYTAACNPVEEPPTQIIEDITPQEAFNLIQENQNNPDFIILDVRTPEEFAEEHIENAINIDYYSEAFPEEIDKLDRDKIYLIYCRSGIRSRNTLDVFEELGFREAYNMTGGIIQWRDEELPTIRRPSQIMGTVTPQEAFDLIQKNKNNPDFTIVDIRPPEEFNEGHIENAVNIAYLSSEIFTEEINKLDKDKAYLIYYSCACGGHSANAFAIMEQLNFREVYHMARGLEQWEKDGLPTVK